MPQLTTILAKMWPKYNKNNFKPAAHDSFCHHHTITTLVPVGSINTKSNREQLQSQHLLFGAQSPQSALVSTSI
jgi:hypothetical protein